MAEADRAEAEARALYWEGEADRARAVVRDETKSRDFLRGATLLFSAAAVVSFAINMGWL